MESAILREKQLKGGSRARKLALIEAANPAWRDLFDNIVGTNCAALDRAVPRHDGVGA